MQTIGGHGLYCPEADDYAAVALYMQDLGTRIDSTLDAQRDALDGFLRRPTIIVTTTVNKNMTGPGNRQDIFDTVLFNNSTFMTLRTVTVPLAATYIDIGSQAGVSPVVPYPQGSYVIGACTRMTATGGVTAFSSRSVFINVFDDTSPTGNILVDFTEDTTFDSNTGGDEAQNAKISVELLRTSGVRVNHGVSNENVASSVDVLAGALLYVTYMGPLDIIEVA